MAVGRRLRRIAACAVLGAGLAGALGGCAHAYVDADGNRNVVGFVHLTLPPSTPEPKAADWMRMRTVGLALSRTDIGGALELGYSDNTLAVVRNNSCVQLNRLPFTLLSSPGAVNASASTDR